MTKKINRYQYETSPRKIEPEYVPTKNPYKGKKSTVQKKKNIIKKQEELKKQRRNTIKAVTVGFLILFALCYRNSKIDESFAKVQNLKEEVSEAEKQNAQLKVSIENSMNLNNIEQQAKELLGMQKLNSRQTVYVTLPKSDYIEAASEDVIIEENKNIIEEIGEKIENLFK